MLIALAEHLEKQLGTDRRKGHIAQLIDNQQRQDGLTGLVHFCAAFKTQRTAGSVVHFASAIYIHFSHLLPSH